MRLSTRLQAVADLVPAGARLADVGCDHALLPISLLQRGRIASAVGIDIHPGPLARAARHCADADLLIELRLGDGLLPLEPGEATVALIAGMGGARIRAILTASPLVVTRLDRLILQPNTDWALVRAYIRDKRMALAGERMVEERGKFYLVIEVDPSPTTAPAPWDAHDLLYGPLLRRTQPPAFLAWVEQRRAAADALAQQLVALDPAPQARLAQLHQELDDLNRALQP